MKASRQRVYVPRGLMECLADCQDVKYVHAIPLGVFKTIRRKPARRKVKS